MNPDDSVLFGYWEGQRHCGTIVYNGYDLVANWLIRRQAGGANDGEGIAVGSASVSTGDMK
jgi:hypothetical protein